MKPAVSGRGLTHMTVSGFTGETALELTIPPRFKGSQGWIASRLFAATVAVATQVTGCPEDGTSSHRQH